MIQIQVVHIPGFQVGLILGIAGACRRDELYNMRIDDIEDHEKFVVVKIPNTENNIQRSFTVTNELDEEIHYIDILRKYIALRPIHTKSKNLFLNYRNGRCSIQVVGRGTIGSWPARIAKYLGLEDSQVYTGHSFRRTSATLIANKGVDILSFKPHTGLKSSEVAGSYVEDSLTKIEFAEEVLHDSALTDARSVSVHFDPDTCAKVSVDGKRKFTPNSVATTFSFDHSTEAISDEQLNFGEDEFDTEYKETDIGESEKVEKIIKSEIVEPGIQDGEAILIQPPQKIIVPDQRASTVRILNTPVNIKNSSTLLQAVKTLEIPGKSSKPNNSWFNKAATAISGINTNLSYAMTQLDKAQSSATNAEQLAVVHNKLQEILSSSINSLIQIRKNLRSDFILDIKTTKFPPNSATDTKGQNVLVLNLATANSTLKRKLPKFSESIAKKWMSQKPPTPIRLVLDKSKATTSHTTPATSHTIPATSQTVQATSHTIPTRSHIIPTTSHTIPTTSHTIPTTSHTIPAKPHTSTKGYLKVRSFRQLLTVPSSSISLPEVLNKTGTDPLKDENNIAEDKSGNSEDKVYVPEKPPSEMIADMFTDGVEQIYTIETSQVEQEGCEDEEMSDDKNDIEIEQNQIRRTSISEEKVGSYSEQNGLFSECSEILEGEVEVKVEPKEEICSDDDRSTLRNLSEES
ncbi:uncharacterized protein LOC123684303 isoform X2 [Harmonia axyridis]|uniref:uncharacterized protein LOC123684303 isoform X2 n=1 Tax=Harmonia axyridis TaxID=115357 RepID=UPI001E2764E4|nr:uncharacterized protein LOC123684303 isoform X2 [Harmonia axyridis]